MNTDLTIIGRAEKADFPELNAKRVPVKIDTGADACSIWVESAEVRGGKLYVVFFGKESSLYSGKQHVFGSRQYSTTRIASSFGHRELRYKVKLKIAIKGRLINATFTLSDRSAKLYPVLIGRTLLRSKFLVDVSKGSPLRAAEKERAQRLEKELKLRGDTL